MTVRILVGDCRETLKTLPAGSCHCCTTSPPYWQLRSYLSADDPNKAAELGSEPTPEEYVANLVAVMREVWRVLRDDATVFLNLGDSYAGSWGNYAPGGIKGVQRERTEAGQRWERPAYSDTTRRPATTSVAGLKPKDLVGIPWRVAFALQADGWYLRSAITWCKQAPMPESVTDRPTSATEMLFLLTKRARYYYDAEAVRVAYNPNSIGRYAYEFGHGAAAAIAKSPAVGDGNGHNATPNPAGRNLWNYWIIGPEPYAGAHFAVMPTALVEPCIKAGTSQYGACPQCGSPWVRVVERTTEVQTSAKGSRFDAGKTGVNGNGRVQSGDRHVTRPTGWRPSCECDAGEPVPCVVLDPFGGAGTTGLVASRLHRDAILCELSAEYAALAERRIADDAGPMFETVTTGPVQQALWE